MKNSREWEFGREVEEYVIAWRKEQGLWIIRTHAIAIGGGAPMLEGWDGKEILPDIITGRDGTAALLEIKGKSHITYNKKFKRREHGIALKNWQSYFEVEKQLGIRCLLGIYDAGAAAPKEGVPARPHRYYESSLRDTKLSARIAYDQGTINYYRESMVFFGMGPFREYLLESVISAPKPQPIEPKIIRNWEVQELRKMEGQQQKLF